MKDLSRVLLNAGLIVVGVVTAYGIAYSGKGTSIA